MIFADKLIQLRKKAGWSQEELAEQMNVSRQSVSKWEGDETIPDIRQAKKMAVQYHLSLDELIDFDINMTEIQEMIEKSSEETNEKINWTNAWGKYILFCLNIKAK